MKILSSADWHILLHKKKVPMDWQINRFKLFFEEIFKLETDCDIHILAGDVFEKEPRLDEAALFADFANRASIRTIIIPGNHEATKKGESFLTHYLKHEKSINNSNIEIYTENTVIEHNGVKFQLFPYGEMQLDNIPAPVKDSILVTHIRGEVPPHITPEYNFEKLRKWKLILLGDLHFNHKYKDFPAYYPGSPMNVTFDRNTDFKYGVNIINFNNIDDYSIDFKVLNLPKLIRKKVDTNTDFVKDDFHHVIYEVEGSIDELSNVINHELLDKKITHKPEEGSKLDLTNSANMKEELEIYLDHIQVEKYRIYIKRI